MKIDMKKSYQTRAGWPVRILVLDKKGTLDNVSAPVQALVDHGSREEPVTYTLDGIAPFFSDSYDLFEVKPEITGWLNIYDQPHRGLFGIERATAYPGTSIYPTKEKADYYARENATYKKRLACIPVTFHEGEGLEEADAGC